MPDLLPVPLQETVQEATTAQEEPKLPISILQMQGTMPLKALRNSCPVCLHTGTHGPGRTSVLTVPKDTTVPIKP